MFLSTVIRSDAQVQLSCHFNVELKAPPQAFAGIFGILQGNCMKKIGIWKGVPGGQETFFVFSPYFVLKTIENMAK